MSKPLSPAVEKVMETRKSVLIGNTAEHKFYKEADEDAMAKFSAEVIAPIISEGDPIGAVILGPRKKTLRWANLN
jgi:AbrB family transcriptional regulator, stage V sporulation protein T